MGSTVVDCADSVWDKMAMGHFSVARHPIPKSTLVVVNSAPVLIRRVSFII